MHRLLVVVLVACAVPVAGATSCNDENSYNVPNSILTTQIKDDGGRTEQQWIVYRDEYCRASRTEVLDERGHFLAYVIYKYDDSGVNARTKRAEVTIETYSPDGTLLFRELPDGRRLDASGTTIDECALLELAGHLLIGDRKVYEKRCHDAS
jgi:hypothetical protein